MGKTRSKEYFVWELKYDRILFKPISLILNLNRSCVRFF